MPFKLDHDCRHPIRKQTRKVANWRDDDASLRQRGSITVWFTTEAIEGWRAAPRTTAGGQACYSPLAILTALTLRAVFRLALRQAEGLIGSIIDRLGLALRVPDHATLRRQAAALKVPRPSRPSLGADGEPMHLLVDSTGLRLCGAGKWLIESPDAPFVKTASAARSRTDPTANALNAPLSPHWKNVPSPASRPQSSPQATPVAASSALSPRHTNPACRTAICGLTQEQAVSGRSREPSSTRARKRA